MDRRALFLGFFRQYWISATAAVGAGLLSSLITILLPVSLGKFFDLLFGFHSHRAHFLDFLPFSFWDSLNEFLLFFGTLVVSHFVANYWFRYHTAMLGEFFSKYLREMLFERQLQIPFSEYLKTGTGKYLLRYSGDMKSAQNLLTKGILRLGSDLILLCLALGFMAWFNLVISGIVFSGLVISVVGIGWLNRQLHRASVRRRNQRSRMLAFVSQRLRAISTIIGFNRLTPEVKKYKGLSNRLLRVGKSYQRIYQFIFSIVPGMLYGILAGTLFLIARQMHTGHVHQGNVLAYVLIFLTIMPVFRRVLRAGLVWEMGLISVDKLLYVLNRARDERSGPDFHFANGTIEAVDLSFTWDGHTYLFERLYFQIRGGSLSLVYGRAGSGKTTLIQLILGMLQPSDGEIRIDEQAVHSVSAFSLRKHVTVISPAFPLLGKTVFEAISYNQKEKNRKLAERLLQRLQKNLPPDQRLELDTPIGELGKNLSSSEQKFLQYVRAMMTRKPIVLIEEPLKGLHPSIRSTVLRWLQRQRGKKTIVLFSSNKTIRQLEPDIQIMLEPERTTS